MILSRLPSVSRSQVDHKSVKNATKTSDTMMIKTVVKIVKTVYRDSIKSAAKIRVIYDTH